MALFIFTLVILAAMVAVGMHVLRRAPYTTQYEWASTYDPTEALDFVVSEVSAETRERLGREGIESVLGFELDYLKQSGAVLNGRKPKGPVRPHVLGSPQSVDYILKRAQTAGLEATPAEVHEIISAEIAYLMNIGAIGGEAGERQEG